MRIRKCPVAVYALLLLLACWRGHGEEIKAPDGEDLVRQCKLMLAFGNTLHEVSPGFEQRDFDQAVGYFTGVLEANQEYVNRLAPAPAAFCEPVEPGKDRFAELAEVVVKYLNANPEKLHMLKTPLLFAALHDSWPCPSRASLKGNR